MKKTTITNGTFTPAVRDFIRLFIVPLIKMKAPHAKGKYSIREALDEFFAVEDRRILSATVKQEFEIPGLLKVAGNKVTPGIKKRRLLPGEKLLIAIDKGINSCNIEIQDGEIYRVTYQRFIWMSKYLEQIGESGFEDHNDQSRRTRLRDHLQIKLRK